MEELECRVIRAIEVLEEQWFGVDGVYRDVFSAMYASKGK
jgi:hypothetical protein